MPSQKINKSFIEYVEHKDQKLTVQMTNGNRYRYDDVPYKHFHALCKSISPGSYYDEFIKGKFYSTKLEKHQA